MQEKQATLTPVCPDSIGVLEGGSMAGDISCCNAVDFDEADSAGAFFFCSERLKSSKDFKFYHSFGWRSPPDHAVGAVKIKKDWFWVIQK